VLPTVLIENPVTHENQFIITYENCRFSLEGEVDGSIGYTLVKSDGTTDTMYLVACSPIGNITLNGVDYPVNYALAKFALNVTWYDGTTKTYAVSIEDTPDAIKAFIESQPEAQKLVPEIVMIDGVPFLRNPSLIIVIDGHNVTTTEEVEFEQACATVKKANGTFTYLATAAEVQAYFASWETGATMILYTDIEFSADPVVLKSAAGSAQTAYLDLNGHDIYMPYAGDLALEVHTAKLYLYSSQPGGTVNAPYAKAFTSITNAGLAFFGETTDKEVYGKNLTIVANHFNAPHGGIGMALYGGTYIQPDGANEDFFLSQGSALLIVKRSTFVLNGNTKAWAQGGANISPQLRNLTIVSKEMTKLFDDKTKVTANAEFHDSYFVNIILDNTIGAGKIIFYDNCKFSLEKAELVSYSVVNAATLSHKLVRVPITESITVNGVTYPINYALSDSFLTVEWVEGDKTHPYWALGSSPCSDLLLPNVLEMEDGKYVAIVDRTYVPVGVTVVAEEHLGKTVSEIETIGRKVNLAFVLCDAATGEPVAYALVESDAIGAELANALAEQAGAATLYVYEDLVAPALTVGKALEIRLEGKILTLGAPVSVAAPLTVVAGTVLSEEAAPFVLSADVIFNGTKLYFTAATTVFSGAGNAILNDVVLYNLGAATLADAGVTATVNGAKLMGVSLGATVTVNGTVLGTQGTFDGCAYADGVVSGLIVNNNSDPATVLGYTFAAEFVEAATSDASKVIKVDYVFSGVVRGTQNYFYGSIANFWREYAPGYFFEFIGSDALTESITYECFFRADASKVQSQVVISDALNFFFLLQVEAEGVLANLKVNGEAIDFASLEIKELEGKNYYVIPVSFNSFADSLAIHTLSVDLMNGDEVMTVSATAELHAYLDSVLATAEEEDAKKAYAAAEYIATLFAYFDYDFTFGDARLANLSRVNGLLAKYAEYKVTAELPETADEITSNYIKSVLLVANEQVTFAFRVANDFAGKIEINGVEVEPKKSFEGFDRLYASVDVALADLDEEITVVVKDASGETLETITYSLAAYLVGVAAQNEGVSGAYAEALWNLSAAIG
ncbi:MAG: hypothetical protein IJZ24_06190, partial [Clostridia bacterium]|nr:hypothetical protein [Clostridia bacterium]